MTVVDVHTHIYPEKIASKAVEAVSDFYVLGMEGNGSVNHYLQSIEGSPITHAVVHSVAVKQSNVEHINNFIAEACEANPNLIGFAAMHQDYENPEAELARVRAMGLKGIKLHPDFQKVNLDDERLMKIYEIAEREHIPLIIHTGDYRYDYSHPRRMKEVLHAFPNLIVDSAHFGGWSIPDIALEYLEDEHCFMDCSSSSIILGKRRMRELIEIYGADRILFGSDFPMWSPTKEYEFVRSLGLSKLEYEKIFLRNAERFLNMDLR